MEIVILKFNFENLKKAAYDMYLKYKMNFIALFQLMSKNKFAFYAIETDKYSFQNMHFLFS